ncbi:heme/hemin ABC transporter substrate-binding protein [Polymorphum gilvum]|uniref:Hemin ABC transporter, periplasmic hemin-binding protein n=1 Tax=Polymorphum gilvum (strain LMG 25793 / CGMCC 1.9160 / SL003B-26A1) TaxID=991905 RepID=F2IZW7_POLGS|nr:hemin ABC transporter substrate-binding protein [Polymorphum gilvum]ADZ70693.1 Hemin ABC transporter, periplasmic hemin-binding protein [Polymorphum gilvum SL003B-26A1]
MTCTLLFSALDRVRRKAAVVALSALLAGAPAALAESADLSEAGRIVALGGSLTEIVYALGEQDRLVARDSTSTYPPEAVSLPDAGYFRALSPEGVLSVGPDAILSLEGSGPPETIGLLRQAGLPIVFVPEAFTAEGILAKVRAVGAALGVVDKAEALAAALEADLTATAEAVRGHPERPRVLFVLSMNGGRVLASGSGTAADGMIALAGAVNAVTGFEGYKQLTDEAITEARPDVILMMDRGGEHDASVDQLFAHPAIALTPAGQNRRVVRMDGLYLLGFGPRTAAAARDLARALASDS